MDSSMLSAADIAAVTRNNTGYGYADGLGLGNGGWFALLILFALFGGGLGGFGWGNRVGLDSRVSTVEDLLNTSNFTRLENQVRFNENEIQQGFTNMANGICQLGYQQAVDKGQLATQLAIDKGELSQQIASCCCENRLATQEVKFDLANYASAINANINEKFAALEKSQLMQTINAQASQINDLRLNQALCGVVRYPLSTTYSAGYPFACCGNYGCNNI